MLPTGTVPVTALVAVSNTETLLLPRLVTYAWVPAGETATLAGLLPTVTLAVTALVLVSITETVLPPMLAT